MSEPKDRLDAVVRAIDDPCDEGGYDTFCRNRRGELCPENDAHCSPPHYPCIARLRIRLARQIVEENDVRRGNV